ncbi:mitochondrial zinc maintenance protein 1, mitochondrial [Thermothelomyces heterothallicus CBS 202.75]|uniref:mitochondrial zinc maintenance protein 1, mitochondrial n=1 Tax=Thermothelomyces heterothallicus CBS 202.75 TaxID=1149848 RepID=UPI003743363D
MAAIQAYRHLLRAARIAFDGDVRMLDAAKQTIRQGFRDKASLPASDPSIAPAIQHAEEVASFLKANLVQGKREGDTYKLRIHEYTERGDNDSIKKGNKNPPAGGVKCCSES